MITADLARLNSKSKADHKKYAALATVHEYPSRVWGWIEDKVKEDSCELEVLIIRKLIGGHLFWTTKLVYSTLQDLGFEVTPSCSPDPANERWFLKW